jgi:Glycogen recognition site of AMP-activated protein kinase
MSERDFHPLVKQLLDGDINIADLPAELRAEGEEALRLLAAVDCRPLHLPGVTARVMAAIEERPKRKFWRRVLEPREIRVRVRPWLLAPTLAAAAALVLWLSRPGAPAPSDTAPGLVTVRFVLSAPDAHDVGIAGTFNQWDARATPLMRTSAGLWTATLTLPAGEHQYAFVVDGERWLPDPAAPAVDDGFGRRNSVLTL